MTINIFDASEWQGDIQIKDVLSDGYQAGIFKASEGTTILDSKFLVNVAKAQSVKMLKSAYHYAHPRNNPHEEARLFINALKRSNVHFEFPLWLDIEAREIKSGNDVWAETFMSDVRKETGYLIGIYTDEYFAIEYLSGILHKYPKWIGNYSNRPKIPFDIWQHSKTGKINGISGNVDLDIFEGNTIQLKNLGGHKVAYPEVKAQLNGKPYKAVAVGIVSYLIWTLARDAGANLTKVDYGDVEIDGKKPMQVVDGTDTYIEWSQIPGLEPHYLPDGTINFTTKPATHDYNMILTLADTEEVGMWAYLFVKTLDNGKPFAGQGITINENGHDIVVGVNADPNTGSYMWAITESNEKTDVITVTWTDPNGKEHKIVHDTKFYLPQPSTTPVPPDDHVVVTIPILPKSDPMNAVFFNITTPDNKTNVEVQLDTGAFMLMFNKAAETALGLVHEGGLTVSGVGGQTQAFYSHANFNIQGVPFKDVMCVIDENFEGDPLFGYKFFIDNGYDLLVSQKHNTVTILK